jgi:hypothetical protein
MLAWRWPRSLLVLVPLAGALVAGWLLWHWGLPPGLVERLQLGINARLKIWTAAVRMLWDMPFSGVGLNNFPLIYDLYKLPGQGVEPHAHNVFLQTAADQGLIGLVAFAALMLGGLRAAWRAYRAAAAPQLQALSLGAAGGLAAFLGYGLWDSMSLGNKPALAVWLLLGMAFAAERVLAPPRQAWLSTQTRQRLLLALGILAVVLAPAWAGALLVNAGRVQYHAWRVDPALIRPNLPLGSAEQLPADDERLARTARLAQLALRLDPHNSRAYVLAGQAALGLGREAEAWVDLARALALDGSDARTFADFRSLSTRLGDPDLSMLDLVQATFP